MFLFPYAHDSRSLQRAPRITLALIFLNVAIHLAVVLFAPNLDQPVDAFFAYYSHHPYLQLPPEMQQFFSIEMLRQLKGSRQVVELPEPSVIADEQQTLDKMGADILQEFQKDQ